MPFIELQTVDSTNNYAFGQIHAGLAQHGMVVFAHDQSAGKGQRGRKWQSAAGLNLALSIVIKPAPLLVTQQFLLSACVAISVHDLFSGYAVHDAKIKWPNDLYWKDRKAGGILIESLVRSQESSGSRDSGSWDWAVIGIGVNINQVEFSPDLPNPVSLKQITGKQFNPLELSKQLCNTFSHRFDQLIKNGFSETYETYVANLYKLNEKVKLKKENRVFEATIRGVSKSGKLVVEHGIEEEFDFGSVEWII